MKPFKNKLAVTIVVLSVAFLGIIIFSLKNNSSVISSGVGSVISPLQKIIYTANDKLKGSFDFFINFSKVKQENEELAAKNAELENQLIEYNRMKDENIDFHYHLDIPQQLSISDIDLTSILSNGLENAFKAVMLLKNERFIELNMQEKCGKLLISIENNYLNEPIFIDGIPISKEKDHGFGTQSIAYTVEKLHGNCQFSTHQHHFKLRVVI